MLIQNHNIMEHGYIKIKENDANQLTVDVKLVNCTLWMTQHEIADLFGVFVSSVDTNLRAIFKSGLLEEEKVTQTYQYKHKNRECIMTLYNLEVLLFISYRLLSPQAQAFREWVMQALTKQKKESQTLIIYNVSSKHTDTVALS